MPTSLDQPAWLAPAWAELGQRECPGAATNPHIAGLFAAAGHPRITSDEVAWCAAYVSACLERAGVPSARTLLARDYLGWGTELTAPRFGAIAVLSRDPDPTAGHVGFMIARSAESVVLLGGNQSNAVSVETFPASRLLSLRWPSPGPPLAAARPALVPVAVAPADKAFGRALAHVLAMEGGYTDDPADPGGPTNFGITLAVYARSRSVAITAANRAALIHGLQHIEPEQVRAIYLNGYWLPAGCPDLPPPVALFHFDTAVNMGTGTAVRMLQTALGCSIDGEPGPRTQAAAAAADPGAILNAYAELRRRRYRSLTGFPRFGRGWLARVGKTLALALSLSPTTGQTPMTDASNPAEIQPKWWGESITIWGAVVTGLAAVLPAIGPAFGLDVSAATVHTAAGQITNIAQAVVGLIGTLTAVYGRVRAAQPLVQRTVTLKL